MRELSIRLFTKKGMMYFIGKIAKSVFGFRNMKTLAYRLFAVFGVIYHYWVVEGIEYDNWVHNEW